MAGLGIFLIWAGYSLGIFGFSKIKSAYNQAPDLSLSDLTLPSYRATYLAAALLWTGGSTPTQGSQSSGGTAVGGAPGGASVITPTSPGGLTGVDLSGNKYTRTCSTCPWKLTTSPTGLPIVST
jgi:hypothetical protein